jgi:hypothetical protein
MSQGQVRTLKSSDTLLPCVFSISELRELKRVKRHDRQDMRQMEHSDRRCCPACVQ